MSRKLPDSMHWQIYQAHLRGPSALFRLFEGMCCKNYFEANEVVRRFPLCGKLEEALDKLRLARDIIPM
jgi:hypothetical protein